LILKVNVFLSVVVMFRLNHYFSFSNTQLQMKDILKYIVPYFLLIIVIFLSSKVEGFNSNVILPLSVAISTVYYLRIDNPHKTYLNLLTVSLVLCFVAGLTPPFGLSPLILKVCIAITALIYLLRFMKREEKLWIDYLKVIIVLTGASVLIIIPDSLPAITIAFGFTYILDRFIIRRQMKKTTQIILFSFLALVCITFVIYGQIKANDAIMSAENAKAAQEEAMQMADMARQQAQDAAAEAIRQQAMAMEHAALLSKAKEELANCKGE
jgi:hypothetical protein